MRYFSCNHFDLVIFTERVAFSGYAIKGRCDLQADVRRFDSNPKAPSRLVRFSLSISVSIIYSCNFNGCLLEMGIFMI